MGADEFIAARVSPETKARLRAVAEHEQLSESALLKRWVGIMLTGAARQEAAVGVTPRASRNARLMVRLAPDDQILLGDRAAARGMAPATFVAVLTRAHLRALTPLPKAELLAMKHALAELGSIGRNLNQIARAASAGQGFTPPSREHVALMLKVCSALRDRVKALLEANVRSWAEGYAEPRE